MDHGYYFASSQTRLDPLNHRDYLLRKPPEHELFAIPQTTLACLDIFYAKLVSHSVWNQSTMVMVSLDVRGNILVLHCTWWSMWLMVGKVLDITNRSTKIGAWTISISRIISYVVILYSQVAKLWFRSPCALLLFLFLSLQSMLYEDFSNNFLHIKFTWPLTCMIEDIIAMTWCQLSVLHGPLCYKVKVLKA